MTDADSTKMAELELPTSRHGPSAKGAYVPKGAASPLEPIVARNVLWACRLRWAVIAILVAFGLLGRLDVFTGYIGLVPPGLWPFVVAGVLVLSNLAYLAHARRHLGSARRSVLVLNLWAQIVPDLIILTVVVHYLGSVHTYIPFAFLFHIILACVFFSPRQSLAVTVFACVLFGACITVENLGLVEPVRIFVDEPRAIARTYALAFPSAVGIWMGAWYLASYLSGMVRARDAELAETNHRLVAAREERSRHMLTMTHELKAPFAAVHANVQLLLKGHCGQLPDEAMSVLERIAARSRRLATEIQELLQLANLNSSSHKPLLKSMLCVSDVLAWCIGQVEPIAQERGIVLDVDIHPAHSVGVEDHLKMLFGNLLANAVLYSYEGGRVGVSCRIGEDSQLLITIGDEGIGIPREKLPHIFDEHYRTKEAVKHNKESSGLGLSIVRHVVEIHGIYLRVRSQPGRGTTFELRFPVTIDNLSASEKKET